MPVRVKLIIHNVIWSYMSFSQSFKLHALALKPQHFETPSHGTYQHLRMQEGTVFLWIIHLTSLDNL